MNPWPAEVRRRGAVAWSRLALAWLLALCAVPGAWAQARVVTLGGTVTEIVYALGAGDAVVGTDISSLYPPEATRLPQVGYYRSVPVEGVAALRPDLVLASEQAGPPDALARLQSLGLTVVKVPDGATLASLRARIVAVAAALGREAQAGGLVGQLERELARAQAVEAPPLRTLVIMNRSGTPLGAGDGSAADAILKLAGLNNVLAGQRGYQPLSAESLLTLAPELIVVTATSLPASGGMDGLLASPGIAGTPAARHGGVIEMDDLLILGLGPRLPQAVQALKAGAARAGQRATR